MKMKSTFLASALAFTIFAGNVSAFEPIQMKKMSKSGGSDKMNVIKIKPVLLALSTASLQYERVITSGFTIATDLDYMFYGYSTTFTSSSGTGSSEIFNVDVKMTGFGISPEFRYYFGGEAPKGFYGCLYPEFYTAGLSMEAKGSTSGLTGSATASGFTIMGGGLNIGYQWLLGGVVSLDLYIGGRFWSFSTPSSVDYKYSDGTTKSEVFPSLSVKGFVPSGGLSLGVAF